MPDSRDLFDQVLSSLASFVVDRQPLTTTLTHVAELARDGIAAADYAAVTTLRDGTPETTVATDPMMAEIDRAQYEADSGPCLDAFRTGEVLRMDSTEDDDRWPRFRPGRRRPRGAQHAVATARRRRGRHRCPQPLQPPPAGVLGRRRVRRGALRRAGRRPARQRLPLLAGTRPCPEPRDRPCPPSRHRAGQGHPHGPAGRRRRGRLRPAAPGLPTRERQAP